MLSQLLALFGFFALILVSVYWVNRAVSLFEQLIGDGQSGLVFLEFTALTLPNVIRIVLPVAGFVAAIYTTNRLQRESELIVMQAVGFSPWRMARPVLIFGLMLMLVLSVLTHFLVPAARGEMTERRGQIAENITARFLTEGSFVHPVPGLTVYVREISAEGELRDIFMADDRDAEQSTVYTARRALLVRGENGPSLLMFEGMAQTLRKSDSRLSVTRFSSFAYDIGRLTGGSATGRVDPREMSTPALVRADAATLTAMGRDARLVAEEIHARFADPLNATIYALIGFAALMTGSFSRFGVWRQITVAVVIVIVMQILINYAAGIVRRNPSEWWALYVPALAGGVSVPVMLWLSARPRRVRRSNIAEVAA